jgi:hypothetical protein
MEKQYFVSKGNQIGRNSDYLLYTFKSKKDAEEAGLHDFDGNYTVWTIDENGKEIEL